MISDDLIPVRNNGKSSRESGGRNGTKNGKKKQREDTKRRSRRNAVIPEDVLATSICQVPCDVSLRRYKVMMAV